MLAFDRYIKIVSGVTGGAGVRQRELILRVFTPNTAVLPGTVLEVTNLAAVGSVFGTTSEEYLRAQKYFGFVSKNITSPTKIAFAPWNNTNSEQVAKVIGVPVTADLSAFTAITSGTISFKIGTSKQVNVTGLDLSSATSFSGQAPSVLSLFATAVNAAATTANAPSLSNAVFSLGTDQKLTLAAASGQSDLQNYQTITVLPGTLAGLLGFTNGAVVTTPKVPANEAPADAVRNSAAVSDNFLSFVFVGNLDATCGMPVTNQQAADVAAWVDSQNNKFMYCVSCFASNAAALYAQQTTAGGTSVSGCSGVSLNVLSATAGNDYVDQLPAEIAAATDYTRVNSVQNYMFYQSPTRNVTVSDDITADNLDKVRFNYIGATQTAGQTLAFYQRGVLCGGATAAVDTNIYVNEAWMKSAIGAELMAMLVNSPQVPVNDAGRAQIMAVIQGVITRAKYNGVISVGTTLSTAQKQNVTTLSGDPTAWQQVGTIGYWLNVYFDVNPTQADTTRTEYRAVYQLIYKKSDQIRMIQGSDILV